MAKDTTEPSDTGVAKNDAYTGMLVISLLALIGGSVLLYLDWSQYPAAGPTPMKLTPYEKAKVPEAAPKEKGPEAAKKDGDNPMPMPMPGKQ